MLHPERTWPGGTLAYQRLRMLWQTIHTPDLGQHVALYVQKLADTYLTATAHKSLIQQYITGTFFPAVEALCEKSSSPDSYLMTLGSEDGRALQQTLLSTAVSGEQLVASLLTHFAVVRWVAHNKPTYTVSQDLAEALQNTQLKNYPSNLLALPFPALFLELPKGRFKVTSHVSETSEFVPAEGVYVLWESGMEHPTWRFIVTSPEEREHIDVVNTDVPNSSVWFFSMELPQDKSVDECIRYTLEKVQKGDRTNVVEIDGEEIETIRGLNDEQMSRFRKNKREMVELFRYVMNVMIYITSAGADITYWNASKEYRDLKARTAKAKGPKREALNQRLKSVTSLPRILLGKDLVIDRKQVHASGSSEDVKRTMHVRTYVPGYWNTYHVGVGRTQVITKLVKPHFRGPEDAPLTTPERRHVR